MLSVERTMDSFSEPYLLMGKNGAPVDMVVSYMSGACLGFLPSTVQYGCWREGKNRPMGELSRLQKSPKDFLKDPTAKKTKKSWVKQKIPVKIFQTKQVDRCFVMVAHARHGGPNHFSATSDLRFGIAHEFFVPHGQALEKLSNLTENLNTPQELCGVPYEPTGNQWDVCMFTLH